MKRVIKLFLFFVIATSAMADNEMTYLSFTNSDPNTPRLTFSGSMLRRSSYTVDGYFRSISSNACNISGYTIHLNWKATGRLQDSPVTRVVGTVMNGTGGWARAVIPKDALNSVGDTTFLMSAFDASNRVAFFWNCTVYDAVDQVSDDDFIPPGDETNFYTMAQMDALLTNYIEGSEADGLYVNTGEQVRASLITVVTTNFQTMSTNDTTAQLAFDDIDDLLSNRYTQAQSDTRYVNTGEVVAASLISLTTNNFTAITGTNAQLATDSIDDALTNRVSKSADETMRGDLTLIRNGGGGRFVGVVTTNNAPDNGAVYIASVYPGLSDRPAIGLITNYPDLDGLWLTMHGTNFYHYRSFGGVLTSGILFSALNDGAGSGLDADLLDGISSTNFILKSGDTVGGTIIFSNNNPATYWRDDDGTNAVVIGVSGTYGPFISLVNNYPGAAPMLSIDNSTNLQRRMSAGTAYTLMDSGNDGSGSGFDADLIDGYDNIWKWSSYVPPAMTNAASNYTISVVSATNLYICFTNNWRGSGTNWGRITVSDF